MLINNSFKTTQKILKLNKKMKFFIIFGGYWMIVVGILFYFVLKVMHRNKKIKDNDSELKLVLEKFVGEYQLSL